MYGIYMIEIAKVYKTSYTFKTIEFAIRIKQKLFKHDTYYNNMHMKLRRDQSNFNKVKAIVSLKILSTTSVYFQQLFS